MIGFSSPKAVWVLCFTNLWETFSYYGTQTVLVLYLIHVFQATQSTSYLFYGAYAALVFLTPTLGGIVADKWLGAKNTLLNGCILSVIGNLVLMSHNHYLFCLGIALALIGTGLYKGNANHLVGAAYPSTDPRKEIGFTWLYLATNVGGTLGPLVYGVVIHLFGWNYGFLCSALGILLGTGWILKTWQHLENSPTVRQRAILLVLMSIIAASFIISLPFYFPIIINPFIILMFLISILYLLWKILKYQNKERQHLFVLIILGFFGMFYFAAGLQIGTTITLFIQAEIQQGRIHTQLPASTFSMFYPLFVLLLAPVFTMLWNQLNKRQIQISVVLKLAIGIILAAFGIAAFAIASVTNEVITGVVIGILLLSAGELIITPSMYTAISNLAPQGMKSSMMGCWWLFVALGGYLSGILSNISHSSSILSFSIQGAPYLGEFVFIAIFTLLVATVLLACTPKLLSMIHKSTAN